MSNKKLFKQIRQLGFTEYEAKCYLALFERESLAVSEVSVLAGIPRSNAYEALEKLLAKGVVVAIPGKIKKYTSSDPWILKEKALETLSATTQSELENLERQGREILEKKKALQTSIEEIISNLDSLYKVSRSNGSPLYPVEILRDPMQVHRKVVLLSSISKKETLYFKKPPYYFSPPGLEEMQMEVSIAALKRGAKIRKITQLQKDEKNRRQFYEHEKSSKKYPGLALKIIDELPIKLMVVDERYSMYCIDDPANGENAAINILTDNCAIATAFKLLFETYWNKAKDYIVIDGKKYYLNKWDPDDPTVVHWHKNDK
jgi:sugar-specific transcriptional regulator TrmB